MDNVTSSEPQSIAADKEHLHKRPRAMTVREYGDHREACLAVRSCVSALRLTRVQDEDVQVALARLENWLAENDGRWTA